MPKRIESALFRIYIKPILDFEFRFVGSEAPIVPVSRERAGTPPCPHQHLARAMDPAKVRQGLVQGSGMSTSEISYKRKWSSGVDLKNV